MLMNNWFECKVAFEKSIGEGKVKKTKEAYLVDAMTFTDAEARIIEEVSPFCSGELNVTDIKKARYSELFISDNDNDDKWYKIKVNFITIDEKTEEEKKTANLMLVQASTLEGALNRFKEGMKGSMVDYDVAMIQETNLLDVFPFKVGEPARPTASEGNIPADTDVPEEAYQENQQ